MLDRHLNPLIAAESKAAAPHNGEHRPGRPTRTVRDEVAKRVAAHNASVEQPRRVSLQSGLVAAERSLVATAGRPSDQRAFQALRALDQLLTLAAHGPRAGAPVQNADLLPVGHPSSTAPRAMTASAARHARSLWLAADPRLSDDVRPLVASAHAAMPGSIERDFYFTQLAATDDVPTELRVDDGALVASLEWMGNSSAAKSARARAQRRDRLKRFAFQGGLFKFSGFDKRTGAYSNIFGRVVGEPADSENFELEVLNHPVLGTGIVTVGSDKTEAIRAIGIGKDINNVNADGNPMVKVPTAKAAARALDMEAMLASKKDAPTGWTKQKGAKNPTWNSDDGYTVVRRPGADGKPQYTLSRNEGGKLSKVGTGETWYDVQNLAEGDSDAYEQSVKARLSGTPAASKAPAAEAKAPADIPQIGQNAKQQAENRGESWDESGKTVDNLVQPPAPTAQMIQAAKLQPGDRVTVDGKDQSVVSVSQPYTKTISPTALKQTKSGKKKQVDIQFEDADGKTTTKSWWPTTEIEAVRPNKPAEAPAPAAKDAVADFAENVAVFEPAELTPQDKANGAVRKWTREDFREDGFGAIAEVSVSELEDGSFVSVREEYGTDTVTRQTYDAADYEKAFTGEAPTEKTKAPSTAKTAKEYAAEQGVNLDLLDKALNLYFDLNGANWSPAWAQNDQPATGLLIRSLAGDKDARDALLSVSSQIADAEYFEGVSNKDKKLMMDASYALNDLFDNLPEIEAKPAAKKAPAPAPTALEVPSFTGWDAGGMYELRNDQPYEPKGRTTQDSPDYTDDPEQLATMFEADVLMNALERAISGTTDGAATLEFQAGREDVPVEAIYEALKKTGADADRVVASVYDILSSGFANGKALSAFRKANNIPDNAGEINGVPMVDGSFANAVALTGKLGNQQAAGIAAGLIDRFRAEGVQNPKVQEVADFLKKQDKYGSARALTEFFAFSESNDPQEQEAFRGLLGLLLVSDGGTDLVIKQLDNAAALYAGDLSKDAAKTVAKYGKYADLQRSKARVARGEEDPDSPDSTAGATYRLVAAMAEPTTVPTFRGMPLDPDGDSLREYTTVGQVINLDVRPTSTSMENAVDYAEIFIPDGKDAVVVTFPAGEMDGIDVSKISPITHEDEVLGVGRYVVERVDTEVLANGKTVHNVLMRRFGESAAVAKTEAPNATFDMPEGAYTLDTSPADTTDLPPLLQPSELAKDFSEDALTDQLVQAIEDGTGQGRLRLKDGSEQTVAAEVLRDALKARGVDTDALIEGLIPDLEAFYDDKKGKEAALAKSKSNAADELYDDVVAFAAEIDDFIARAEDYDLPEGGEELLDELRSTLDGVNDLIDNAVYEFDKGRIEDGNGELMKAGETLEELYNRQGMLELGQTDQQVKALMDKIDDLIREEGGSGGGAGKPPVPPVAEGSPEPEEPRLPFTKENLKKHIEGVKWKETTKADGLEDGERRWELKEKGNLVGVVYLDENGDFRREFWGDSFDNENNRTDMLFDDSNYRDDWQGAFDGAPLEPTPLPKTPYVPVAAEDEFPGPGPDNAAIDKLLDGTDWKESVNSGNFPGEREFELEDEDGDVIAVVVARNDGTFTRYDFYASYNNENEKSMKEDGESRTGDMQEAFGVDPAGSTEPDLEDPTGMASLLRDEIRAWSDLDGDGDISPRTQQNVDDLGLLLDDIQGDVSMGNNPYNASTLMSVRSALARLRTAVLDDDGLDDTRKAGLTEELDDEIKLVEEALSKVVAALRDEPQGTADSYAKNLADFDYNFDTDGYYKSPDGRLEIDNTDDLTQVRYDGELVGEFEKSSEGADGEMYRIDDNLMSERVIDALEEHLKGKTAPEEFVYTGKKAEPATAPQRQLVKDLLANDQVPQDVRERIQADLDAKGADLNKGQIGVHIAELRDFPGSTTPTNRQLNSVKRELVARGVDEETAQALRDRLETMTRDEVSKEIKKLKAMPDVAGDTAKERGYDETTTDDDREQGVRRWQFRSADEETDTVRIEEVLLDNDGFHRATTIEDDAGDDLGNYFESLGNSADRAFTDRSPEAAAKRADDAAPREWADAVDRFGQTYGTELKDPETGFTAYVFEGDFFQAIVIDDRGNEVFREHLYRGQGESLVSARAAAAAALDDVVKQALDARTADPAGFAQGRALEDLNILADMAGELRGVAVEGGVWDRMTKAARQAIADLGEPEVLNSNVPGVLDRFVAGTASADDVKAASDFVQQQMDILEKQAGPLHSVMLPKVRQFMESLGKVTPFTTVATDKVPGDTTLPDGSDLSGLKRVGPQAGSNEGGTYEDADGNQYYVKVAKSQAHADSESLASKLYQAAGVSVVDVRKGTMNGKPVTFSPIVGESGEKFYSKLQSDPEFKKKVQEGFIVDAWLSNWDVAGLDFDNVIVNEAGTPVRVDTGGALEWRAQGQPKTSVGVDFFEMSFDARTLRDPAVNAQSAAVFGDMTDEQLDASARKLFNISEMDINRLVDEVMGETRSVEDRDKMKFALKQRRQDLIEAYVDYPAFTEPEEYDYNPDGGLQETSPQELKDAIEATFDPSEVQVNINTNWTNPRYEAESQMGVTIHPGPDVTPEKWEEIKKRIDSMYDREDSYFDALDREPGTGPGDGLLDKVRLEGGLTVKPLNNEAPTEGIVVAVQGHNLEVPQADFFDPEKGPEAIAKWLKEKAAIFDENGAHHIGMWYDKKNQEVVLDVVEVFTPEQRDEAIQAGQDRNQQAIWDLGAFEEIPTGGTGDRAEQQTTGPADSAGDTAEGSGVDDRGGATGLGEDDSQPGSGADQAGVGAKPLDVPVTQNANGVNVPSRPLTSAEVQALRDGTATPPALPFAVRDTDSGDVHYYDSTGTRRWGQFGAAGILLTRTGQDGNDEFLLVQRANTLSTEPGKWTVPGGAHKSKADATKPHATAETELGEETGAVLDNNGLRKEVKVQPAPDWAFDYTVAPVADDFNPAELDLDPFELQSAEWFTADDVRDLLNEGKLHSAMDSDTIEKLIEAGSTPFEYDPNLMPQPQSASPGFGSRATYKLNDRVEVDYDPDDEGIGFRRTGTVVGLVPGSMNEYVVRVDDNPDNGNDAGRLIEVMPDDMRPDVSEPAKPTVVENEPQAAPASPPDGPDGPNTGGDGASPPDGPDEPDEPSGPDDFDPDMPDVEEMPAEIAPGDVLSMQKIKERWPNHTVLDNGDIVVDETNTARGGRLVTRQVVIRRNATEGNNVGGKNETYTVYAREVDTATGEVRTLEYKNRSHSNKALGNQVAKMRDTLAKPSADAKFKKAKVDAKAAKPKVLKNIDHPDVKAMLADAISKAPGRSDDENLGSLIQVAGQLSNTPENREALAEAMKNWVNYFGSGEAVRAVFDAVQAGDGDKLGQMRKVTHLSKNGVEIQDGMRVSWTSPDGKKTRMGTVVKRAVGLDSKGYGFTDYVYVRFDDNKGKYVHRVSDRLVVLDRDDNPLASPDGAQGAPSGEAKDLPTTDTGAGEAATEVSNETLEQVMTDAEINARGYELRQLLQPTRDLSWEMQDAAAVDPSTGFFNELMQLAASNGQDPSATAKISQLLIDINIPKKMQGEQSMEELQSSLAGYTALVLANQPVFSKSTNMEVEELDSVIPGVQYGKYGSKAFFEMPAGSHSINVGDIIGPDSDLVQVMAIGQSPVFGIADVTYRYVAGKNKGTSFTRYQASTTSSARIFRPNEATLVAGYVVEKPQKSSDTLPSGEGAVLQHRASLLMISKNATKDKNVESGEPFNPLLNGPKVMEVLRKSYPVDSGNSGIGYQPVYPGAVVYRSDGSIGVVTDVPLPETPPWAPGYELKAVSASVSWLAGPSSGKTEVAEPAALTTARGHAIGQEAADLLGLKVNLAAPEELVRDELITKPAAAKKAAEEAEAQRRELMAAEGILPGPGAEAPTAGSDYDQSPVEGVQSLQGALEAIADNSGRNPDAVHGTPVLLDAGDVEDGQVILHQVEVDGNMQTKVRFTLTAWGGDALAKRLIDERTAQGKGEPPLGVAIRKYQIETRAGDDVLVDDGDWSTTDTDKYEHGVTYVFPIQDEEGVTIGEARLHRARPGASSPDFSRGDDSTGGDIAAAWHNKVDIVMFQANLMPDQVADALRQAGITDPGVASPEALKVIKENKIIALLENKLDGAVNYSGEGRAKALSRIEQQWGLTADDINIEVVPGSGHVQYIAPREFGEKVAAAVGVVSLQHGGRIAQYGKESIEGDAAKVIDLLSGEDALTATAERWSAGKNYMGMSSTSDVLKQGGNYMFFTPYGSSSVHEQADVGAYGIPSGSATFHIDAAEAFRRLDWYVNTTDRYGRRTGEAPIDTLQSMSYKGDGELMIKHTFDMAESVLTIGGLDKASAELVIQWFDENRDGKLPNGRPIRDAFPGLAQLTQTQVVVEPLDVPG